MNIGNIVVITDLNDTRHGRIGIVVGKYTRASYIYANDVGVIFPGLHQGGKYVVKSYKKEQMRVSAICNQGDILKLQKYVTSKGASNVELLDCKIKEGIKMKDYKFFKVELADGQDRTGYTNIFDTIGEANTAVEELIRANPTCSYYILEAVSLVRPKSNIERVELRPQPQEDKSSISSSQET